MLEPRGVKGNHPAGVIRVHPERCDVSRGRGSRRVLGSTKELYDVPYTPFKGIVNVDVRSRPSP